jgi:DNA recombination protein RmuC
MTMDMPILILLSAAFILLVLLLLRKTNSGNQLENSVRQLIREELRDNRSELSTALRQNREELAANLDRLTQKTESRLLQMNEGMDRNARFNRQELSQSLKSFSESFTQNVSDFNGFQKQRFDDMSRKQDDLIKSTEQKLEKMRETVDEKLHKTLEERLGQSFKLVTERLEAVREGLGEMKTMAGEVGDLKRVLSNVKTRGILGEIQLGNILEQIMAPDQYEKNVKTKKNAPGHVEYAIKLPGREINGEPVFLPVDAKFPQEDYARLQDAFDKGDADAVNLTTKQLITAVKKSAAEIRDKYLDPPHTTDFGIMFLPVEGLYAEIVRQPDLITILQRDYKVIVTGPTTLAAFLNSLQMGFKTLAIQKRSSEVWEILGAVKYQFGEFGKVLKKAQDRIRQADTDIETLVTTRTNVMMRKLTKVQELPAKKSSQLLNSLEEPEDDPEESERDEGENMH